MKCRPKLSIILALLFALSSCRQEYSVESIVQAQDMLQKQYDDGYQKGYSDGVAESKTEESNELISGGDWTYQIVDAVIDLSDRQTYKYEYGDLNHEMSNPKADFSIHICNLEEADKAYISGRNINNVSFLGVYTISYSDGGLRPLCIFSGLNEDGTYGSKRGNGSSEICLIDMKDAEWYPGGLHWFTVLVIENGSIYSFDFTDL